jgi:hypothetical protein
MRRVEVIVTRVEHRRSGLRALAERPVDLPELRVLPARSVNWASGTIATPHDRMIERGGRAISGQKQERQL